MSVKVRAEKCCRCGLIMVSLKHKFCPDCAYTVMKPLEKIDPDKIPPRIKRNHKCISEAEARIVNRRIKSQGEPGPIK